MLNLYRVDVSNLLISGTKNRSYKSIFKRLFVKNKQIKVDDNNVNFQRVEQPLQINIYVFNGNDVANIYQQELFFMYYNEL
jgi:hypothetical protein